MARETPAGARGAWAGLLAFLVALFAFRLWFIGRALLIPDEAYYWTWTRRLAACYYDQPGMVAWIGRLFTSLFGQNVYGVRLAAWVLAAASTFLVYRLALNLMEDRPWAMVAAVVANTLPVFAAGSLIYIHDNALMFFWTLSCLALARIARGGGGRWWLAFAVAVLGTLYAKFSGVLIGPCVVLFLLLSRPHRAWLARREPYLAAAVVAVLFLPVLAWNRAHLWVAFHAVEKLSFSPKIAGMGRILSVLDYLGGQVLIFTPVVFGVGAAAMVGGLWRGWRRQEPVRLLYACLSLPVFIYFLALAARTKIYANWPMFGFVTGSVLTVDLARRGWQGPRRRAWRIVTWIAAGFVALGLVVLHVHPLKRIVPGMEGRDVTDQLYGWDGLARRVDEEWERAGRGNAVVMTKTYQVASELEFYMPDRPRPYCASYVGRGTQYDVDQDFGTIGNKGVIFVVEEEQLSKRLRLHFRDATELPPFVVTREGRPVRAIRLYLLRGFSEQGPFRDYFADPLGAVVRRMIDRRMGVED